MRALLSTRLFAVRPLDAAPLRLARRHGFPELELHGDLRHFDFFDLGEVQRVGALLAREGLRAPWLRVGAPVLNQLSDERRMLGLVEAVRALRLEAVVADMHTWGVRQDGAFQQVDELRTRLITNGARLVLDLPRVDERLLRRLPSDVALCWDLAGAITEDHPDATRLVDDMLSGLARGRLLGVRVAHLGDGIREPPDTHEAAILEEAWRLQAPGTLIYDVDDPTGFGVEREIVEVLEELRAFHAGEKRPHPAEGGGLFWSALAPG